MKKYLFELAQHTVDTGARALIHDFQTPPEVCRYMASLVPEGVRTILEPTPGDGNLVRALEAYRVTAPADFFLMEKRRFDCIVMNPPFSTGSLICDHAPTGVGKALEGIKAGYYILKECMDMSDNVIALMPWFTISDSDVRLRHLKNWGLISITSLPRKTFGYARIQTMVLQLQRGYTGKTEFLVYDSIPNNERFIR